MWLEGVSFSIGLVSATRLVFHSSQVYVEGNLETRMFNDPSTGLVKRLKEVAVRQSGEFFILPSAAVI